MTSHLLQADAEVRVIQADRDAAAEFYDAHLSRPGEVPVAAAMRMRHLDESPLIQAFARHRLLAEHQSKIPEGWRPIESAPKDGTEFQAWCLGFGAAEGWWDPRCRFHPESEAFEVWGRVDYDEDGWDTYDVFATHWMPFPTPPSPEPRSS